VFKSEVLWRHCVSPFRAVGVLTALECRELLVSAAEMLQYNRDRTRRVTATQVAGGLAVYGRQHKPCPRCGEAIRVRQTGRHQRATYWCPACQVSPEGAEETEVTPTGLIRPLVADPHPAAQLFLSHLPTRRVDLYDDENY
jgi:endonuclease-8